MNETTRMSGLSMIALPMSPPAPVTRLTTPAGKPASSMSSTRSVAHSGASELGLNTTVLPATSAGIIFQHGIAIGKFHGVTIPAMPSGWRMLIAHLSGSSDGHRVARHPASLARHEERDVDALLDVAPRLREDLAHLAGHRPGEALLVLRHERAEAVQDLAALRGRGRLPRGARHLGGADRHRHVRGRAGLEPPDDVTGVRGVDALEGLAAHAVHPAAGDEQLVRGRVGGDLGHGSGSSGVRRRAGCAPYSGHRAGPSNRFRGHALQARCPSPSSPPRSR